MNPTASPADGHVVPTSVLCAHSDSTVPAFLRDALNPAQIACAPSGYEALKAINASAFDAYILDYWFTDWSGVSLCREIRKMDPNVPICIYSRTQNPDYQRRALRAGADLVLSMPEQPGSLRERLESLLRSRQENLGHARSETERVIEEELDRQTQLIRDMDESRKQSVSRVLERKVKSKALTAFLGAGGTCAHFERTWQQVHPKVARALGQKAAQAA